ncbi:hypothetical protein [Tenacibaculum maritimum]|uniref:hypothetical protein n=1 Tax=Tenacibaculum maritimum TaxID=107401 RepID=UPI0012E6E650|nr:hypothetical protein [Tenacibaculum maritimum]CAA0214957.1 conserved hypothetical protein [Tenacibaculum maritimum]CAA0250621.1 conserved hypothetical protein [Tenacibaculum maritimum]
MNPEEINTLLYRPLKSGIEYDHLMPFSDCSSFLLTTGDTKAAIDNMAIWSHKYKHHTKDLANAVFKGLPLHKLCKELHSFLYNHFQYKLDGYEQKLRSPACSWVSKEDGIDCKSYSIFASTVLSNLGVSHYLRRVIQNQGEGFSHVYVVIPKNQKTNDLKDGYYVIDGTLQITDEVKFYEKDDVFVVGEQEVLGSVVGNALANSAGKVISVVTDILIKGLLNELFGCDDAAYEAPIVKLQLERDLLQPLTRKLDNLGHAIRINNAVRIEHIFNSIFKEIDLGIAHLRNETAYSQRDECIAQTLATALKYAEELKKVVDVYYVNFKNNYSHFNIREFHGNANVNQRTLYFVVENDSNPITAEYRFIKIDQKSEYDIKPIFGFREDRHEWLTDNVNYLKTTYKDGRENKYKEEIEPLLGEAVKLRAKYYIGGEMLYYLEQPIQSKMNGVWLKYDDKYAQFLKEKARKNYEAVELALATYQERFKKEVEEDRLRKKRKKDKMHLAIGLTAVAALVIAINTGKE